MLIHGSIISHDWFTVITAVLNRYPNPINPSVIACDVIDRRLDQAGRLYSHRLLTADWSYAPALRKFFRMIDYGYASEHSIIDRERCRMSIKIRNLILHRFIQVEEHLEYTSLPDDRRKTLLRQELTIRVQKIPLQSYLESIIGDTMNHNSMKVGIQCPSNEHHNRIFLEFRSVKRWNG